MTEALVGNYVISLWFVPGLAFIYIYANMYVCLYMYVANTVQPRDQLLISVFFGHLTWAFWRERKTDAGFITATLNATPACLCCQWSRARGQVVLVLMTDIALNTFQMAKSVESRVWFGRAGDLMFEFVVFVYLGFDL